MNDTAEVYLLELVKSLHGLKSTAEKAIVQVSDEELHIQIDSESNSIAIIMKHISGNMISRFTDFLTSDGEKEWRKRDNEFIDEEENRNQFFQDWNKGWDCLFEALAPLKTDDLLKIVFIRGEEHTVIRALQRQLVHYAYHTGQIVYICKHIKSAEFKSLSIPRKQITKH